MTLINLFLAFTISMAAHADYWIKIPAKNVHERDRIANLGVAIENVTDDYVLVYGTQKDIDRLKKVGFQPWTTFATADTLDFPPKDSPYHNYDEVMQALETMERNNPDIVKLETFGYSVEGRKLVVAHITRDFNTASTKPGTFYLGTHHAREHLSTEIPLMMAEYYIKEYRAGNPRIVNIVNNRHLMFAPLVNPDGAEYDIEGGRYKFWRKNRARLPGGEFGVDLNRNYGYGWGGGGASPDPDSDTYRGPSAFSEPETQAVKAFIEAHTNISTLLSFHTFSELILYPWGGTRDRIAATQDQLAFKTLAEKMAQFNRYRPMQASDLYVAAGDTCDWAYGERKIFAFTFELDPKNGFSMGDFYPGAKIIDQVFQKNIEPVLMLAELADNPYRILNPMGDYGLSSPLLH